MKDKRRPKNPVMVNIDHLIMLHHEAADHLQMMHDLLETRECLTGECRGVIGHMVMHHWNEYMDVMKMIICEDHIMANSMQQCNMDMRKETGVIPEEGDERVFGFFGAPLIPLLLFSLIFRHRRRRDFFGNYYRHGGFEDYLSSTSHLECDHIANITTMLNDMI